jgi:transcriptional regulator with XRE-family HTH domain
MTLSDTQPSARAEHIGDRIRDMRRARSFTLVQLAEAAGLSHPFLSQLERGLASPSMASLERIARALGTSQVELLSVDGPRRGRTPGEPVSVVRAGSGVEGPYSEGIARMLVEGARPFHPMEYRGDNAEFHDHFVHDEDEWMYVLDGDVNVELGHRAPVRFGPGDAIYLAGGVTHRLRSSNGDAFRLLIVKEHPARL